MKHILPYLFGFCCLSLSADPVYLDKQYSFEERSADLISRMTLEEKIGQLMLYSVDESKHLTDGGLTKPFEWYKEHHVGSVLNALDGDLVKIQQELGANHRLGIPVLTMIDAINGHAFYPNATVFPSSLALSHSWNSSLLQAVGRVTAKEMSATGFHVTFSPGLDIAKDLRWGRVGETFGEDTLLVSELGRARIKGYQNDDLANDDSVAAVPKHLIGYGNTLGGRDATELLISEREIRQFHLPPFADAIQDGNLHMVMAAYNAVLGEPASTNSWLLKDVLRNELGFKGFVISDWENFDRLMDTHKTASTPEEAALQFLNAGNEMAMSAYSQPMALKKLVASGQINEEQIDQAVLRVLNLKFELGLFDNPQKVFPDLVQAKNVLQSPEHTKLAYEAAVQSTVLLKNKQILPMQTEKIQKIALVGPNANDIIAQLGDWSLGFRGQGLWQHNIESYTRNHETLYSALKTYSESKSIQLMYAPVVDVLDSTQFDEEKLQLALHDADVVIAVIGDTRTQAGEQLDRAILEPTGGQLSLMRYLSGLDVPTVTVLLSSKPLVLNEDIRNSDALIAAFNPGMKGGTALVDLIFGKRNFSGKLTTSFLDAGGQTPGYYNQPNGWHGNGYYADLSETTKRSPFPFGFGQSYSEFEYGQVTASVSGNVLKGTLNLKNSSTWDGTEIVQFYGFDEVASVTRPAKQLVHFERVEIGAGETVQLEFEIPLSRFAILDKNLEWQVESGDFRLLIGGSSASIYQQTTFHVERTLNVSRLKNDSGD